MTIDKRKILLPLLIMIAALVLSACGTRAPVVPTPNPEMIKTEAAMTIQVALTQTVAAKPSSTPTVAPTNTSQPTSIPSATSAGVVITVGPATATKSPDSAAWAAQNPGDGVSLQPGQQFTLTWQVKNTGTTTWNTQYMLRYYLSDPILRMGAPDQNFSKEVKPDETLEFSLAMTAPTTPGSYTTFWVLTNKDGANFSPLSFNFNVGQAVPTPTGAPVATATPESVPTTAEAATPTS